MILFHGTNQDFETIDLNKCTPYKDFGRGFYLTDIFDQALAMAQKRENLFGGTAIVHQYEFDEYNASKALKMLRFDNPDENWAEFIYKNRSRAEKFQHDYDIVYGPIANDGVAYLLGRYEEGSLELKELARELEFRELNNQYYFANQKSLGYLKRI